jgi:membrane-bound ClpP family serine protease
MNGASKASATVDQPYAANGSLGSVSLHGKTAAVKSHKPVRTGGSINVHGKSGSIGKK